MRNICETCQRGYSFKKCRYREYLRGNKCSHYTERHPSEKKPKEIVTPPNKDFINEIEWIISYQKKFPK